LFEFFRSRFFRGPQKSYGDPSGPTILPRDQHGISRRNVSEHALKVLYRLNKAGFEAYMVGGGVRDLLLGREPKDFDVATDARPEEVRRLFGNCRLIGRRFRLAHVRFGHDVIEVATFRALAGPEHEAVVDEEDEDGDQDRRFSRDDRDRELDEGGRILRDNVYGSLEEDAFRRDFTVNALYYNIADFSVVDYVGGVADLKAGLLRLIGDPEARYREDPVRMLRAIRFAAKLGFRIERGTEKPIAKLAPLLRDIPAARLYEEVNKMFLAGVGVQTFELLRKHGLFGELFPQTEEALAREEGNFPITFLARALKNTDDRVAADKAVTPAFLYAALLWEPVRLRAAELVAKGENDYEALKRAGDEICAEQVQRVALPRRFSTPMREIFELQPRFESTQGKRAERFVTHPRFRAAYDFFVLRAEAGEASKELAKFWTDIQRVPLDELPDAFRQAPREPRGGGRGQGGGRAPQRAAAEPYEAAPGGEPGPDGAPFKKKRRRRGGRGRRRKPGAPPPSSGPAE
jgi:poly(A) polymerase